MMTYEAAAPRQISAPENATIDDNWLVMTRAGIASMTLDELDQAFQRGEVDAQTRVFTAGMSAWDTLGALANLDDPSPQVETQGASPPPLPYGQSAHASLEPTYASCFPPMAYSTTAAGGTEWWQLTQQTTGVQRSPGRLQLATRRASARLADAFAALRGARQRLAVVGLWALGTALSVSFIFALYRFSSSSTQPAGRAQSSSGSLRTPQGSAAVAGSVAAPAPLETARGGAAQPAERAAPRPAAGASEPSSPLQTATLSSASEGIAVVRPSELRRTPMTQERVRLSRTARARARRARVLAARDARDPSAAPATQVSPRAKQWARRRSNAPVD
jgi:hypothetical protein